MIPHARGLRLDIREMAAAIPDATVTGRDSLTFRPLWHSRLDRSASLRLSTENPAGFVVHSFAGDDPIALRDYVKACLRLPAGERMRVAESEPFPPADRDSTARALALWDEAAAPAGTPVEVYLRRRGLRLPPQTAGVLRYHRRCPLGRGVRTPCMLALIRSVRGDAPIGVQRTALTDDGLKNRAHGDPKRVLGTVRGGAVKLTPDEDVTTALGVAEGVENALALAGAPEFGATPAWAMLGTAGLGALPVLAGVESLWIAVDRDRAGEAAALAATERWAAADREVHHVRPNASASDLNDCTGGRA